MVSSLNKNWIFLESLKFWKLVFFSAISVKNFLRCLMKPLHAITKCISSSNSFGQRGQNRSSLLTLLCLPFSIISLWFESRDFDMVVLTFGQGIRFRSFSRPNSSLICLYVLSLLLGWLISAKASWWNMSLSLWKILVWQLRSFLRDIKVSIIPILDRFSLQCVGQDRFWVEAFSYDEVTSEFASFKLLILCQFWKHFSWHIVSGELAPVLKGLLRL